MKKLLMASVVGAGLFSGVTAAWSGPLMPLAVKPGNSPIVLAQSADPEVQALQEQVRQLNGRIEEMSYQLLQMQEQMRKTQEDNEFRFQDLEKGGAKKSGALEQPAGGADSAATADAGAGTGTGASGGDDVANIIQQPSDPATTGSGAATDTGTAPAGGQLGSIDLDENGNPVKATISPDATNGGNAAGSATASAGTGAAGGEDGSYQIAYGHVLGGDYAQAEQEFRSYIADFPQGKKIADAHFWLGEAYYSQGKFNEAAKTFLKAHQTFGKSPKAPEMLLKLGMSLAALDNNETACATLREVTKRYPKASRTVINKVASEEKRLSC
jgi:tol-pal system protein YbgF